ncbi:SDR family NAD(P)-dependent oxidoreductase [Nocardia alni]|uniref:SDR family NAD(P)-dependent oxidoreductase n=1 Tax=Nocardia alni TaxID=2815723 RepID=UPI001C210469|nr:glucose 1-dehydrogenase [Nocardia alni]
MTQDTSSETTSRSDLPALHDLIDLSGKRAVVTGGGRGIGAAIARRLAEAGARVLVGDIDADSAKSVAAEIKQRFGRQTIGAALDVASSSSLGRVRETVVREWGGLDLWVNNAGIFPTTGPLLDATDEHVDHVLRVNVRGTYAGAREAARALSADGVIVNLASTAAFKTNLGTSAYIASKSAVVGLTRSLALELGHRGIRVLGVAPTVVETPGVAEQLGGLAESGVDVNERLSRNPLRRAARADDIARVVLFCCTPLASMMTGSTLLVDGGSVL